MLGTGPGLEQPQAAGGGEVRVIGLDADAVRLHAKAATPELEEGLLAHQVRRDGARAGDIERAAIAAIGDVSRDLAGRGHVVHRDRDGVGVLRRAREDDQLLETARAVGGFEHLVVELDPDQDRRVDPPLTGVEQRRGGVVTIERVDQQGVPAAPAQGPGQPLEHHELVGVGEIVDQQRHEVGPRRGERRGAEVRDVTQRSGGGHDLFAGGGRDRGLLLEGAVHRPARDPGGGGHVIGRYVGGKAGRARACLHGMSFRRGFRGAKAVPSLRF